MRSYTNDRGIAQIDCFRALSHLNLYLWGPSIAMSLVLYTLCCACLGQVLLSGRAAAARGIMAAHEIGFRKHANAHSVPKTRNEKSAQKPRDSRNASSVA